MELSEPRRKPLHARAELPLASPQSEIADAESPTGFAALLTGEFPTRLLERAEASGGPSFELARELRERHGKLLAGRPLPELLANAALVRPPPVLPPPVLGETATERFAAARRAKAAEADARSGPGGRGRDGGPRREGHVA